MEEIKNVLLVVNPISGALDKTDLVDEIKKEVIKRNATLFVFETSGREDVFNLKPKIEELNPWRILVAGGDGTIKLVAESLENKKIPLGIIPAGSANGLAYNLQLPSTLEEQITTAFEDNFTYMDIIEIDGEYCLHMSDFGVNAELISRYEKSSIRGKWGYFLQSVPTLVSSDYPFNFTVEANGSTFETKGILLAIANASSYGTGAMVNPNGKMDDGSFEILIYKEFDFIEILKTLRNEVDLDPEVVEIITTKEAKITCKTPVSFQIDGEYLGKRSSIQAKILPKKLMIAIPS
ncbi:MAG TPA: diacylglycerol kinase family protein [Gillisia sp.]|nr:diacylglycerol kinase family protein [Gillisia sp.]